MITSLSVGVLLSPVSKIEAVKRKKQVDKQRLGGTFTQMKFVSNFSLLLPPSEVPVNSNGTYLLMTLLSLQ